MIGGFILIISGVIVVFLAVAIATNTSIGGTRSDHNDGSGCIAITGLWLAVAGVLWLAFEIGSSLL